jgi:hypothetical protein
MTADTTPTITESERTILAAAENIAREVSKRFASAAYDADSTRLAGYHGRIACAYDTAASMLGSADITRTVYRDTEPESTPEPAEPQSLKVAP